MEFPLVLCLYSALVSPYKIHVLVYGPSFLQTNYQRKECQARKVVLEYSLHCHCIDINKDCSPPHLMTLHVFPFIGFQWCILYILN